MKITALKPMPTEKQAFALARYSRSADSIEQSLEWVDSHDEKKFLETFYFQYGHASIADLGHIALSFEGISELAAAEILDHDLLDAQQRSTRYQDFGNVEPVGLQAGIAQDYSRTLYRTYREVLAGLLPHFEKETPRGNLGEAAYKRAVNAKAFDVARYLLPLATPTGLGIVCSIRTLEKLVSRLKASPHSELRQIGEKVGEVCQGEGVAPTLAKHLEADTSELMMQSRVREWLASNLELLPIRKDNEFSSVALNQFKYGGMDAVATLLYEVTDHTLSYRSIVSALDKDLGASVSEILELVLKERGRELPRTFRSAPFIFDLIMDIGAYRDLHRHRRVLHHRKAYTADLGYEVPEVLLGFPSLLDIYTKAMSGALELSGNLSVSDAQYILPFGTRMRCLMKMDFAEADYLCRLRTKPGGHIAYRKIAWEMSENIRLRSCRLGTHIGGERP